MNVCEDMCVRLRINQSINRSITYIHTGTYTHTHTHREKEKEKEKEKKEQKENDYMCICMCGEERRVRTGGR